ncbi:MAG: hypothetical protein ACRDHP_14085, partial [Ktedonobacterales bacterium]
RTEVARSESPDWLTAGLQRLDGELQGAGARLDMSETRLTAQAMTRGGDSTALTAMCRDLWRIVDVAAVAGQQIADPHLLPEAVATRYSEGPSPARGARMAPSPPASPSPPAPPRRPAPPIIEHVALPRIEPGSAPLLRREETPAAESHPVAPPPSEVALPTIGESTAPQSPPPAPKAQPRPEARTQQRPDTPSSAKDDEPPFAFPDIG